MQNSRQCLACWDSNCDPDRYQVNFMIIDNNNNTGNSRIIEDVFCKVGDSSLSHMFCCKSKRW